MNPVRSCACSDRIPISKTGCESRSPKRSCSTCFSLPSAIISATDGTQQFREEGRAAAIAIRRSDLREIEKPGPRSDGKLILWVNDRAIAPQHAELVFDGREWNLRNEGDAPVTILPAGPRVDPGGAPYRFDRDLRFRIRDWEFQFAGGDPERQALGEIQIEKAQDRTPGLDTCAFRAFGCVVELGSPRGFWSGRGDQLPAVVEALCDAVAARCGRGAAGPVTMLRDAASKTLRSISTGCALCWVGCRMFSN